MYHVCSFLHFLMQNTLLWNQSAPLMYVQVFPFLDMFRAVPNQNEKPRVSVWDRLGMSCDELSGSGKRKTVLNDAGIWEQELLKSMLLVPKEGASKNKTSQVTKLVSSDSLNSRTFEPVSSTSYETHIANNIRQKRYFGAISAGHAICTVSSDSERNVDIQCKGTSQDLKKLNLVKMDSETSAYPVSICSLKNLEGDLESRTVFVSNVHLLHLRKLYHCILPSVGWLRMVVLIEKITGQPKGSAYATFAGKDAVTLCGATFFPRIVKVVCNVGFKEGGISASSQPVERMFLAAVSNPRGRLSRADNIIPGCHLQWRRETVFALSEASVAASVE
ncbi:hypothetical protein REPUB_Repub03eG0000500 [Reevesia pubescens]